MNFLKKGLLSTLFFLLSSCASSSGFISVEKLLANKEKYSKNEVVEIKGYLIKNKNGVFLLNKESKHIEGVIYVHLSIPESIYVNLDEIQNKWVILRGKYLEHEIIQKENKIRFLPSRVLISEVEVLGINLNK